MHTVRNTRFRETELLGGLEEAVQARLPLGWTVALRPTRQRGLLAADVDATLAIAGPDGRTPTEIAVTAKTGRLTPKEALQLAMWAPTGRSGQILVAAPYLSRRACALLASNGFGYFDMTGNLRISLERPVLYLETQGADRDPWGTTRSLGSLRGPAAARVVRALCDFRPPYGVRDLGERIKVPAPTVSRVVELLEQESLIEREPRGPVRRANPAPITRRWVEDYGLLTSNRTASYVAPRGVPWLCTRLAEWDGHYAVTGSLAVPNELRVAPPRLAVVYVDSFANAVTSLDLREADTGTNVLLVESFGGIAWQRTRMNDDLPCVALSQAAADLLTSPGRGPAEGDELLAWMGGHEDAWRA